MESYSESQKQLARPYRKAVLRALLFITLVSGLLFFVLNTSRGNYPLAYVELGMALYSVFILWAIRRTAHLERWILAYALPFFTAMMFALLSPRATATVFAWVLLVPILSHLLMGRRLGLAVSLFFMSVAAIIFFVKNRHDPELMEVLPIANIAIMSLCILVFSHIYEITREQSESRLLKMAQTDPLTGLANRARLEDVFEREKRRSQRHGTPLSILLLDLDHFKNVNDDFGHEAGDMALRHVSDILQHSVRATDLVARLGGEEFALILSNTDESQSLAVAENVRQAISHTPFPYYGQSIRLTVSGGLSEYGPDGDDLLTLLSRADNCLYLAKNSGRNRMIHSHTLRDEAVQATRRSQV